ncbi:hypothetical protein [Acinetobacter sp.]|uniref:hypothetical protein n=1 Tax=Acinetobacter sp. TaxID=472 RepID=UPI00388EA123
MAQQVPATAPARAKIELRPTDLKHVFLCDWNDDGLLKEIAVVMEAPDGSIYGIEVDKLHPIDKGRLKKFLVSVHADKYPLWELLSQGQLNNGINPLDFFHTNYVRIKRPRGAILGGGLASVEVYNNDQIIGSKFSDPRGATIATEKPEMM